MHETRLGADFGVGYNADLSRAFLESSVALGVATVGLGFAIGDDFVASVITDFFLGFGLGLGSSSAGLGPLTTGAGHVALRTQGSSAGFEVLDFFLRV